MVQEDQEVDLESQGSQSELAAAGTALPSVGKKSRPRRARPASLGVTRRPTEGSGSKRGQATAQELTPPGSATAGNGTRPGSTAKSVSTAAPTANQDATLLAATIARTLSKDPRVRSKLEQLQRELFHRDRQGKAEKNDKALEDLGMEDEKKRKEQLQLLEKYFQALRPNPNLAQRMMERFMATLAPFVEQQIQQEVTRAEMQEELEEYRQEQKRLQEKELRWKMAKFLQGRQQANDILNFVVEKEAYDSDEEFNIFDQAALGLSLDEVRTRLTKDFKKKLSATTQRLASPAVKKKVEYLLDANAQQHRVSGSPSKQMEKPVFVPSPKSPAELARQNFDRSVGANYFDDQLK